MQEQITLSLGKDGWLATFSDPAIVATLGTDTVPCPYTRQAPAAMVLREIQRLNPSAIVTVAPTGERP